MVQGMITKIFTKACHRYGKEFGVEPKDVQLLLKRGDDAMVYKICTNFAPIREVTFDELLDVDIDFMMREMIATPSLLDGFEKLKVSYEKGDYNDIKVIMYSSNPECSDFNLHTFCSGESQGELSSDFFFNASSLVKSI
jgi:hypothetical protein